MKKATITVTLLLTFIYSFSQTVPDGVKTKEDYLRKSKHQKTAAWIMLGGGLLFTGIGIASANASGLDYALGDDNADNTTATIFAVTGVLSTLGSVPMFIVAGHNKRKAATLSFNMQKMPMPLQLNHWVVAKQPSVSLNISF